MASKVKVGGITPEKDATAEIQQFCEEIKEEILKEASKDSSGMFKALKFRSRLVAGIFLFVKIQLESEGECIHVKMFQSWSHKKTEGSKSVELFAVQSQKRVEDEIDYF